MSTPAYAALWSDGEATLTGTARLGERTLRLDGATRGRPARRVIPYGEIAATRVARENGERLAGRPALVLELTRSGRTVRVSTPAPGALLELAGLIEKRLEIEATTR